MAITPISRFGHQGWSLLRKSALPSSSSQTFSLLIELIELMLTIYAKGLSRPLWESYVLVCRPVQRSFGSPVPHTCVCPPLIPSELGFRNCLLGLSPPSPTNLAVAVVDHQNFLLARKPKATSSECYKRAAWGVEMVWSDWTRLLASVATPLGSSKFGSSVTYFLFLKFYEMDDFGIYVIYSTTVVDDLRSGVKIYASNLWVRIEEPLPLGFPPLRVSWLGYMGAPPVITKSPGAIPLAG